MTSRLRATPALTVVVLIAVVAGVGVRPVRAATGDPSSGTDAPELIQQIIAAYGGIERWNAIRDGTYILRDISHRNTDGKAIVAETRAYFTKDPRPAVRLDLVHGENLHTKVFDGLEAWIAVDE